MYGIRHKIRGENRLFALFDNLRLARRVLGEIKDSLKVRNWELILREQYDSFSWMNADGTMERVFIEEEFVFENYGQFRDSKKGFRWD